MCEQTEINYLDGEVVWVKLGSCWWPGEVVGPDKLPPDVLPSFRKPPIAVVKFFKEDAYEYVKNINSIYKYNCNRKHEFINKGLYMYRSKHGHMEKFPEDVIRAEAAVGGDITILTREEFQEPKKESYADLFCDPSKKTLQSNKKGRGKGRLSDSPRDQTLRKINVNKPNYKMHILVQGPQTTPSQTMSTETASTPSTSRAGSEPSDENKVNVEQPSSTPPFTPKMSTSGMYSCHACAFTTTRLNVLILHNKTHSVTFMPYTPSPIRKKITKPSKSSPNTTKTTKVRKSRPEKIDKTPKKSTSQKRVAEDKPSVEVKKIKTDEQIKSSLLADWDIDDDSNDESSEIVMAGSPEVAAPAESPAVAPPAELPEAKVPTELPVSISKNSDDIQVVEKPESSSDSKYEFCEDEDWVEEADVGRKIPRVMNPKRKEDAKSISLDDDEVAREVAELLNKTTVPELPSAPEPLKVEENFPEPSIVKSPDKKPETVIEAGDSPEQKLPIETPPPKTIFKTKTFFRSRHSRSQDAIGKYVAEQLNAERLDISEDINGSEMLPAEVRISPPTIDPVKMARLAPKIQLKKMKAEAAQMREKEKKSTDKDKEDYITNNLVATMPTLTSENLIMTNSGTETDESQEKYDFGVDRMTSNSPNNIAQIEVEHLTKSDDISFEQFQEDSPKDFECVYGNINIEVKSKFEPELNKDIEEENKDLQEENKDIQQENKDIQEENKDIQEENKVIKDENKVIKDENKYINEENKDIKEDNKDIHEDNKDILKDNKDIQEENKLDLETTVLSPNKKDCRYHIEISEGEQTLDFLAQEEALGVVNNNLDRMQDNTSHAANEAQVCGKQTVESDGDDYRMNEEKTCNDNLDTKDNKEVCTETEEVDETSTSDVTNEEIKYGTKDKSAPHSAEPFMNESTASAVDALLSVSRETDRVTRLISNDLPEDLFEDDNKDSSPKNINGLVDSADEKNNFIPTIEMETNDKVDDDEDVVETNRNENLTITSNITTSNEGENVDSVTPAKNISAIVPETIPSESDLQIAETLINLPATTINNKADVEQEESIILENKSLEDDLISNKNVALENNKSDVNESCVQDNIEIPANHITDTDNLTARFETEQEKSENLYAAQSLVQMSESIEPKINVTEINITSKKDKPLTYIPVKDHENIPIEDLEVPEQKMPILTIDGSEVSNGNNISFDTSSPKLLKILEEPCSPKKAASILTKQVIVPGKEKILSSEVGKPGVSGKSHSPKQKIIIRRSNTPHKNLLNHVTEVSTPDQIILSRSNNTSLEGSSVQTYTIQTATNETVSDPNTIVIQQKGRKISKPTSKLQKIKPHTSVMPTLQAGKCVNDVQNTEDVMFDINSMPIVLSEDILTPESIEKMPIVMSDGNILSNPPITQKAVKPKQTIIESEKIAISPTSQNTPKQEFKTLIVNPVNEGNKVTTPNILSRSSKIRGTKMLLIDKTSGKQKIIMTKQAPHVESTIKENKVQPTLIKALAQNVAKPQPTLIQAMPQNVSKHQPNVKQPITQNSNKTHPTIIQSISPNVGKTQSTLIQPIAQTASKPEKFILLPTAASPRPGRTQKIVIDPQTGKAHMFLGKSSDSPMQVTDNKPVSAKLVSSTADSNAAGNTVMIITNAQGAQSRIVLKPEHEKILFPNKQQQNVSQLKTITHRVSATSGSSNKSIVSTVAPVKTPTRIVPKQKGAIITSKGQLIVGGRVATTAQNIAPMPEIRPAPKRIISSDLKKISIQKNSTEPLIFFQQKSGAMMQLTAAQFEHLQRTGQIIQKTLVPPSREGKVVVQKAINISPNESVGSNIQKSRVRKQPAISTDSPAPVKKMKHEVPIAPTPTPMPALCPISNTVASTTIPPTLSSPSPSASTYSGLDNFEELLPSTAIARQPEPAIAQPEQPAPTPGLSDSQLLAVPGEHFGGPSGSFYLCVEENGTFTPIDNRPLVLENNQLVPMPEPVPAVVQPERRDILEAALANSDVFHGETRDEAPDFRDLNANVSVHCRVSETSTTLNQPIMTPVEVPSKVDSEPAVPSNLEDGLAVIGVTPHTVPTSLELPITVTDPRIALKTTDPLSGNNYGTSLLASPNTEMSFVSTEEVEVAVGGPISMPLLTDEESVGKSMPILTDDVAERIVSSVESTVGSPSSVDVRDSETDEGGQWSQRLLTPSSDASDRSAEIPLRPQLKLSVGDIK